MADNVQMSRTDESALIDISGIVDDMWKGALRFWWFLILVISIFASAFYARIRLTYTPYYVASASYAVTASSAYGYSSTYYNQATASEIGTTLQYILTSNVMQTMVADDMGKKSVPGTISVSVIENTNLVTISASAADGQTAYSILESVIKLYPSITESVVGNTNLEVMDESGVPMAPGNPVNLKASARNGVIAGVGLDIIFLLAYALSRKTIRKEDDLKKRLNIATFGTIPKVRFKKRGNKGDEGKELVLMDNFRVSAGFVEAVRTIGTRLMLDAEEKKYQVYLITSAIPGEGKSTVAANIALSLERKGKTVILADFDLRHPSLADACNINGYKYGTIDVLKRNASLEEALVDYPEKNISLLPGGDAVGSPSRYLGQDYIKELIGEMRLRADYILLDTSPCAILSDAAVLAQYADSAIFVVRQDFARTDRVLEGIENLAETGINISGCILNQAEAGVTGHGYSYSYGYGRYGYNGGKYGYGGYGAERTADNQGNTKDGGQSSPEEK